MSTKVFVHVIARTVVKCGINVKSWSENGNFAVRAMSGIYPQFSLLLVLSQINTIASFIKVKISSNSLPR